MDCVAGFVSIPGCWIVWLGCVDSRCQWVVWIPVCFSSFLSVGCVDCVVGFVRFRVAGLCGLCCWVVLISSASILLLGLFFWYSAGGLCGFRCDIGVDCGCG